MRWSCGWARMRFGNSSTELLKGCRARTGRFSRAGGGEDWSPGGRPLLVAWGIHGSAAVTCRHSAPRPQRRVVIDLHASEHRNEETTSRAHEDRAERTGTGEIISFNEARNRGTLRTKRGVRLEFWLAEGVDARLRRRLRDTPTKEQKRTGLPCEYVSGIAVRFERDPSVETSTARVIGLHVGDVIDGEEHHSRTVFPGTAVAPRDEWLY
jgi:hypothetical protein